MISLAIIGVALCAVTVALTAWGVALPRARAAARVRDIETYGFPVELPEEEVERKSPIRELLLGLGAVVAKRLGGRYEEKIKADLIAAGLYEAKPRAIIGAQFVTAVMCGSVITVLGIGDSLVTTLVLTAALSVFGWYCPRLVISNRAYRRTDQIERKVPDMIDMLVVTIEAGLGFAASMQAASLRLSGPLGAELRLTMQEQEMGLTLRDALFNCAERTRSRSMSSFVRAVTQGESLGVSIGTVMRNIAAEMRVRRRQEAEERAQKAPVKMLFPLIFLMFPALLIVILGPALFEIFEVLGGL